jgi:ribose transport system substrate-binding protein
MHSNYKKHLSLACVLMLISGLVFGASMETTAGMKSKPSITLAQMRQTVLAASAASLPWSGPETGPQAAAGKVIAIIAEDLRNGGILGVAHGIQEAAQTVGWRVRIFDSGGTLEGRQKAAADALELKPDGLILDGTDAQVMSSLLQPYTDEGIPIVGWHVGPVAGPMDGQVAMNVSTDPLEVAKITSMAAIVDADGQAGVVIFTDSNFEIAMAKANAMADVIRSCTNCSLLEIRDVAISDSAKVMPAVTRELLARYGKHWTHGLAINDIYFDYAVPEFIIAGSSSQHIHLLSAGDGSSAAFLRIQSNTFQTSTVAEPLNLHGWQLVDELNRLIENKPVSGFIFPPHLITADNIPDQAGAGFNYDPNNGYRDIYRRIWGR